MSLDCFYCTMRFIKWYQMVLVFHFWYGKKRTLQAFTMMVIKLLLNGHIANLVEGTYFPLKMLALEEPVHLKFDIDLDTQNYQYFK